MNAAPVTLRCACGSAHVVAVSPGDAPQISEAADIMTSTGRTLVAWCAACWPWWKAVAE